MTGMIASVDIITGEKTVLDYLLKPVKRATANAMRSASRGPSHSLYLHPHLYPYLCIFSEKEKPC